MKKILLAPNSFKECSISTDVASKLESILRKDDGIEIAKFPISDGGDGFLDVCISNFQLQALKFEVTRPYDNDLFTVRTAYSAESRCLYIESAEVIGLKLIPEEKRNPLLLSTKGLGKLFKLVIESGLNVDKIIVGIGGTGTSDLGLGVCSDFGLKLFDFYGNEVEIIPKNFVAVKEIVWPKIKLPFQLELITDVDNELLGSGGAVRTFARQKGASNSEIETLETGFNKVVNLIVNNKLIKFPFSLSGAGGGLAY